MDDLRLAAAKWVGAKELYLELDKALKEVGDDQDSYDGIMMQADVALETMYEGEAETYAWLKKWLKQRPH